MNEKKLTAYSIDRSDILRNLRLAKLEKNSIVKSFDNAAYGQALIIATHGLAPDWLQNTDENEKQRITNLFIEGMELYLAEVSGRYNPHEILGFSEFVDGLETNRSLIISEAERISADRNKKLLLSPCIVSAAEIEERDAEWVVQDFIPRGQITVIGGDGGTGKGFTVCDIISGLTRGAPCMLDQTFTQSPLDDFSGCHIRDPMTVLYLSGEDTFEITLRPRLRHANADLSRVLTMSFAAQLDSGITIGSEALEAVIDQYRPDVLVIDPLESFLGETVRMSERNSMRQTIKSLLKYGEVYGLTTILVCHTNKGRGVWGRKRLADSSDLWDIARSVLLVGWTPDKQRYIAHEKSNYGPLQKTVVFEIKDNRAKFISYSDWGDREYVLAESWDTQGKSTREDAKGFIIETLQASECPLAVKELDELAEACGYSGTTLKRAKTELKKGGKISFYSEGYGSQKQYFIRMS